MKLNLIATTLIASGALAAPALAHHSFAMFDSSKTMTLVGTVKEFQWTNPHTWIQVNVPTNGKVVEWSIEGGSPNGLARRGWKSTIMKPGDKITVVIAPMKDGSNGGSLKTVTLPDGKTL
jgi:uncharacterized protein DUF6152